MRLVLAALVCSTGCAQIFGIDETTGLDASTSAASVQVQKVLIGASILKSPQDMSMQMATFYDDSAMTLAPVPGVLAAMDTFTAQMPGTPPVIFTLPDVQLPTRMLALPSPTQKTNYIEFEHANRQDPLPNSQIQLAITLPSAYATGELFTMSVIGAWMTKNLVAATQLPPPDVATSTSIATTFPYADLNPSITGNLEARITTADAVLLLRYATSRLTGVFQAPPFEQTDGTDIVSGTMTAVPAASMATATTMPTDYVTRFAAVRPGVTSGLTQTWSINAAPGHSLATDTGVRLINGALADALVGPPAVPAESAITAAYGNPFESLDWKAVMRMSTTKSRSYTFSENGMMAALNLAATMITLTEPGMGLSFTMPAGLPITIEANQQTLVTDGMMLPLDLTQPVQIEATLDRPTNTAYELNLTELSLDTSGASPIVVRTNRLQAVTTGAPRFRVPPEVFTVGKSYFITIRSYQGTFPGIAEGDLQQTPLPFTLAQLDSAVFTVGMP